MKQYSAILVDDDALNIVLLKRILSEYCINIDVVGEALNFDAAIAEIDSKNPDIIFLDVLLKEGEVFEMIDQLNFRNAQIIFVTSEPKFAFKAFRYNAADFILKPAKTAEVIMSVNKAVKKIELQRYFNGQEDHSDKSDGPIIKDYLAVASVDKIDFVKISDVMFFTADGKYTTIYLSNGKKYFTSKNLGEYERSLDKGQFFRIHHSYIINMDYVVKINKKDGTYCELSNGLSIPIAKRRQEDFNRFIKIKI